MFVGHYAPAFVLKSRFPGVALWQLCLAALALDILFFIYVPFSVETLSLDLSKTALLSLQIAQMHWSHSLASTIFYGLLVVGGFALAKRVRVGLVLAAAIGSHWFLDVLVHTQDVPLAPGLDWTVGFSLWKHIYTAFIVEIGILVAAAWALYRRLARQGARFALATLTLLMLLVHFLSVFVVPMPKTTTELAVSSEFFFAVFAYLSCFIDQPRFIDRLARLVPARWRSPEHSANSECPSVVLRLFQG